MANVARMEPQSRPLLAALWMSGAMVSFSLMAIAGRELSGALDTFEIMTFRSLIGVLIVVAVATATGRLSHIRAQRMALHGFRNVGHFVGQNLWFYAVATIPLAQVFAFEFSTPIWVALLAPIFLGERMTRTRVTVVTIGFAGILIILRPATMMQPGVLALNPGVLAAASCVIGFAISIITTKFLSRTEAVVSIMFWMTVMQAIMGLICAGHDGDIALPRGVDAVWVTVVACCGLGAHFCLTTALSLAPASVVSPLEFLRLPLIAFVGLVLYQEPLQLQVFIGAGFIVAATIINLREEHRRSRAAAPETLFR